MKKFFLVLLVLINFELNAQAGKKYIPPAGAYIDLSKPPYNMKPGMSASLACEQAIDSLYKTYHGGTVFLPFPYNWDRPHAGSQKGVRLRSNIIIEGAGQRLTLINNCSWFSSDFGTDSLGFEIIGNLDRNMTNIRVVSSAGAHVGDTVYGRFGTAPYDAGEPFVFGWFIIAAVPDAAHITLNKPCGANMAVSGTVSKNRRLILVHNLVYNATIKNLELYSNHTYAEAGISIQGGFNITVDAIHATNPGAGLAGFQFCEGCVLKNSVLDSCANQGNANWGRGVTINECVNCQILKNTFNKYQRVAIVHEANNPGAIIAGNIFNNNFNDSPRVAVVSLGSGDITLDNNRFTGFKHILFDQVKSFGKLTLLNTMVDKGTPFEYYEQQGIITSGFLRVGDARFNHRKTYTKKFLLPFNGTYIFDSLPKGMMLAASVMVDDTTGITAFYFRRDNSYTNNCMNFSAQLRSGKSIQPNLGACFLVGAGLHAANVNYNMDKGFLVTTNATARHGKYCTVSVAYLESNAGPYNEANKLAK